MDQKTLHEWLSYDEVNGIFRWKKRPSQSVREGDIAGSIQTSKGQRRRMISIKGCRFYASRAAYVYVNGDLPKTVLVDHINGDTTDDRIANLRLAGTKQNVWNRLQREGSQHKLGVSRLKKGRWRSTIQPPGAKKKLFLGTWDTEGEAHAAYMGAAAVFHGEYWIGHRDGVTKQVAQKTRATEAQGKRK